MPTLVPLSFEVAALFRHLQLIWLDDYAFSTRALEIYIHRALTSSGLLSGAHVRYPPLPHISSFYLKWTGHPWQVGLHTKIYLDAGTPIGIYLGQVRRRGYHPRSINPYCFTFPLQPPWSTYLFRGCWTIDALYQGNHTRFINHSDSPNCVAVPLIVQSMIYIMIQTSQAIQPHQELFYHYGDEYWSMREDKQS